MSNSLRKIARNMKPGAGRYISFDEVAEILANADPDTIEYSDNLVFPDYEDEEEPEE